MQNILKLQTISWLEIAFERFVVGFVKSVSEIKIKLFCRK
jgi:hypothetical protein